MFLLRRRRSRRDLLQDPPVTCVRFDRTFVTTLKRGAAKRGLPR
jgi:hypothetical protein